MKKRIVVDVVIDVVVVLLLLSLGSRSALVTRTGSDSYRLGFSTQVLKLSSGWLGKIVVVAVAVAVAGIVRTKTLRDQFSISSIGANILCVGIPSPLKGLGREYSCRSTL